MLFLRRRYLKRKTRIEELTVWIGLGTAVCRSCWRVRHRWSLLWRTILLKMCLFLCLWTTSHVFYMYNAKKYSCVKIEQFYVNWDNINVICFNTILIRNVEKSSLHWYSANWQESSKKFTGNILYTNLILGTCKL